MFKRLFKKKSEPLSNMNEVTIPCACDRDNEHCDLILQLRKCQDLRKRIKDEIEIFDKDNCELLDNFFNFLKKLELSNFRMNSYNGWIENERNFQSLKYTIDLCSSGDIFRMTEELKTYKNKTDIVCEKQRALKAVEDDIKNIKTKLGIE